MGKKILTVLLALGMMGLNAGPLMAAQGAVLGSEMTKGGGSKSVTIDDSVTLTAIAVLTGNADLAKVVLVDGNGVESSSTTIDFGTTSASLKKAVDQYIKTVYTTNMANGAVAIHTDNINSNPAYDHDWDVAAGVTNPDGTFSPEYGAGLVLNYGTTEIRKAAPILWTVFNNAEDAHAYTFTGEKDPITFGYVDEAEMQDPMKDNYATNDSINFRTTVWWGYGSPSGDYMAPYPAGLGDRYTTNSTIYLALAADFRGLPAGSYNTTQLIVELFHQ